LIKGREGSTAHKTIILQSQPERHNDVIGTGLCYGTSSDKDFDNCALYKEQAKIYDEANLNL